MNEGMHWIDDAKQQAIADIAENELKKTRVGMRAAFRMETFSFPQLFLQLLQW